MAKKNICILIISALCVFLVTSYTDATDLFEPYLKVYGIIRTTLKVPSGMSAGQAESNLNRIFLNVDKEFAEGKFGFHTQTQYQQEGNGKYPNEVWLEEGYGYYNSDFGKIKLGKVYTPFGIIWDHTFYGSIIYYKGFMLDADYGLTFERTENVSKKRGIDLKWIAGYFVREDDLNGQTLIGEGYEYLNRGERNTFALRLNPKIKINDKSSLQLGLSGLTGEVKAPGVKRQAAVELDAVYTRSPLTLTGEYVFYDRAYPGKDDTLKGDCFLLEANMDIYKNDKSKILEKISLNYNYSRDNPDDGNTLGQIHLSSITLKFNKYLSTEVLYVNWSKDGVTADRSWWMIFYVGF
jgi:hypothetical protein